MKLRYRKNIRNVILWMALCATLFVGMYAGSDLRAVSQMISAAGENGYAMGQQTAANYDCVWGRENECGTVQYRTAQRSGTLQRLEFRLRNYESRSIRVIEVFSYI